MAKNLPPGSHSEIFWGTVCGLSLIAWVMGEFLLGFHTTSLDIGRYSGYFSIILPVTFIFIALSERQTILRRKLPFIDGINIGFKIALISAAILAVFFIFYNKYINPEWIELTVDWQRKHMILSGATDDDISRFLEQSKHLNSIFGQFVAGVISSTGIGIVTTLIEIPLVRLLGGKNPSAE